MARGPKGMARPVVPSKTKLETVDQVKETIIVACKIMEHFGLIQGHGHVSARVPGKPEHIFVTHIRSPALTTKEDLSIIDLEDRVIEAGKTPPFGERGMHIEIYRARPDVGAICRFHSEMTSVFGILKRPVKVVHALGYVLGPEVPVFDSPELQMGREIGLRMAQVLGDGYGIIFRGNGAATVGSNVIDACVRAVYLEESARLQYKASLLGKPVYLSLEEINTRNERYWEIPSDQPYGRSWEYFKAKALGQL